MKIYKYPLPAPADCNAVRMPKGERLLTVQCQHGQPCVWAVVDPEAELVTRLLLMFGTGHLIRCGDLPYIGTFQLHGGELVFHLFDGGEE